MTIHAPGKFEGEPDWAPELWDLVLEGGGGDDVIHGGHLWTYLEPDEAQRRKYLDLREYKYVGLYEDDQGFVHAVQVDAIPKNDDDEE